MVAKAWLGRMATLAGIAILLSGCAGMFGSDEGPTGTPFTYNGVNWLVIDDAGAGTLTIATASPQVSGPGTLGGYRYAVSAEAIPADEFAAAARGWFAHTGRFCTASEEVEQDSGLFGQDSDDTATSRTYSYRCDWLP